MRSPEANIHEVRYEVSLKPYWFVRGTKQRAAHYAAFDSTIVEHAPPRAPTRATLMQGCTVGSRDAWTPCDGRTGVEGLNNTMMTEDRPVYISDLCCCDMTRDFPWAAMYAPQARQNCVVFKTETSREMADPEGTQPDARLWKRPNLGW